VIEQLNQMFGDEKIVEKIKHKLPYMFFIAEVEMLKSGKVGTLREQIVMELYYMEVKKQ
jgi:hypothetical protein